MIDHNPAAARSSGRGRTSAPPLQNLLQDHEVLLDATSAGAEIRIEHGRRCATTRSSRRRRVIGGGAEAGQFVHRRDITTRKDAERRLLLDLGRFMVLNDTFGHDAGDRILEAVGARLRDGGREEDVAALWHTLRRDELDLVFQPVATSRSGCLLAMEALARSQHPRLGLLMPAYPLPSGRGGGRPRGGARRLGARAGVPVGRRPTGYRCR